MEELSGKVAVVTGAASGIGLAMSRAFAAEGMKVVMADIEGDALEKAAAELPEGAEALQQVCDVADAGAVDALRDATVDRFGTAHLICNNAGVSSAGPAWTHTVEDWEWVVGVNLYGVVNGIRSFTPLLIEQGEGHIVNTASMAGLVSPPFMSIYNVTKHAVVTLSETLWGDLQMTGATEVGVSVLCPGWVNTRIHEAGRNRPGAAEAVPAEPTPEQAAMTEIVGGLLAAGLDPADVAGQVLDAVRTRRFYILTHPDWVPAVTGRTARIADGDDPVLASLPM